MGNFKCFTVCPLLFLVLLGLIDLGNARTIPNKPRCKTRNAHTNSGKTAMISEQYKWRNFRVYIEQNQFSSEEQTRIENDVRELQRIVPCIRFTLLPKGVPPTGDYVRVTNEDEGCYSSVGKVGGKQDLNLGDGCFAPGTIIHEMIHALGVHHEQGRTDRNDFINIFWENMAEGMADQFDMVSDAEFSDYGVPYNTQSLMHYDSWSGSANGKAIVTTKDGSNIEWQNNIQDSDIQKLRRMYGCNM